VQTYLVLLRGINVGGKNKLSMARLKAFLEELGYSEVSTYIASGNVILKSELTAGEIQAEIEEALPKAFKLDSELIKVHVLTRNQLQAVIDKRPRGFGDEPAKYHSDAIFLMGLEADEALGVFDPRDGVDRVWPGDGVIHSQRLSAQRTRSRLSKALSTPAYKSMTIRSWSTTTNLLEILDKAEAESGKSN
jgi:uncharacterized protein (DUF1697 family)